VDDKAALRRLLIQQRVALAEEEYRQCSRSICQHLQVFLDRHPDKPVLAYYPHRQEPDILPLVTKSALAQPRRWGLPRCLPDRQLAWHNWQPGAALVRNAYGIWEPASDAPTIDLQQELIAIIPAVGFDDRGYRLGYGGGYFDRMLAAHPQILPIGVAFDCAQVPALPIEDWDVPLAGIFTTAGMVVDRTNRAL
jgi:5-formyltetrahydrofolate cyclo-ligase